MENVEDDFGLVIITNHNKVILLEPHAKLGVLNEKDSFCFHQLLKSFDPINYYLNIEVTK